MIKWAIELSQYGIRYKPRLSIKGQVLANFITELPQSGSQFTQPTCKWWSLHVDGAALSSGAGIGIVLVSPKRERIEQAVHLGFPATNNEAKYEAILVGLDLALAVQAAKINIQSNSQLVAAQIQNEYEARNERMISYLSAVKSRLTEMEEWQIVRIPREQNSQADALAGIAASLPIKQTVMLPLYIKVAPTLDVLVIEEVNKASQGWMKPIKEYLERGIIPDDEKLAHKLRVQAARYALINEQLYRRSFGGPYLKCLSESEVEYVLAELHEGVCDNHPGGRMLSHRAHSQGYYWPTMRKDA